MLEVIENTARMAGPHHILKQDRAKKMRIFLVDDNVKFLETASRYLQMFPGFEIVGWSTSGQKGLDEIQAAKPDVVIMDLIMPGFNGIEATRKLRQQSAGTKVIIVSFQDGPEYKAKAEASGADGFFSKMDFCEKVIPFIHGLRRSVGGDLQRKVNETPKGDVQYYEEYKGIQKKI